MTTFTAESAECAEYNEKKVGPMHRDRDVAE
jgi:hypothetical protein